MNDPHNASAPPPPPRARAARNQQSHFIRQPGSIFDPTDLASDYVDVWAEREESYGEHTEYMGEWQSAMQRRGLQTASADISGSLHNSLSDALYAAMDDRSASSEVSSTAANPTPLDGDSMNVESDVGDDERDDGDRSSDSSTSSVSDAANARNHTLSSAQRHALDSVQFPAGGKNAKRRRERAATRMHERAERMQQRCDDAEREIMHGTSTTTVVPPPPLPPTTNTTAAPALAPTANTPKPLPKNYTSDQFFDALDAAVKHAQATSTATVALELTSVREVRDTTAEVTPNVPTTAYMRQICGDIMADIDPLVAYRMIFTVDYIRHVHQFWSARMYVPIESRPRMKLKVAAEFLRNDSLYIDRCSVLEPDDCTTQTMVQFSCKFNNMLPEDQEEADRKRKPFRPFNEAELRADVDEYCTATSLWTCDVPGRVDNCTNAMLSDSASAYEKSPMGDVMVYWHSFVFGFRAHGTTQV